MTEGIAAALALAQTDFGPVVKSQTNKHFGSKYADLSDVLAAVIPALNAQGIAVTQPIEDGELVTRLTLGGEHIESRIPLNLDCKPQELGSQLTYLRRYSLSALVCVASEDDDDGNAASTAEPAPRRNTAARVPSGKPSEKQLGYARKLLKEVVHHSVEADTIQKVTGSADLDDLDTTQASTLIDFLLDEKKAGRTPDGDITYTSEPF